ncbi:hypothetical protein I3760_06G106700 [Carya illinoinensis]|nr:hypothetical protein I3760_06G106700 [Carya illinoinensis]
MDSTKGEKLRAMNSYEKSQFLYSFILHALIVLTCSLLFPYCYWFPSLCCAMKHFLFTTLPNISAFFVKPKCLFIVVNVIVVFLVGESKLFDANSSPASDLYDEYVERSHSLRGQYSTSPERKVESSSENHDGCIKHSLSTHDQDYYSNLPEEKEERKLEMILIENSMNMIEGKVVIKDQEEGEDQKDQVKAEVEGDDEEEMGLPAEELNKRADEFIARFNKQMRLEANSMVCAKA